MKLNNRGWGLSVFLSFAAILVLCIIVAGANAYKVGLSKEKVPYFNSSVSTSNPSINNTYSNIENKILNASMNYKRDYYKNFSGGQTVIVKVSRLVELNYLSDTDDCIGYVEIKNQNNDIGYNVYLKCPNYVTEGYNSEYDS